MKFCSRDNNPNDFNPSGKTLREQLTEAYKSADSFDQRYVYVGRFSQNFIELLKNNGVILQNYPIAMNYRDSYLSMHSKETGKYHGVGINYHNLGIEGLREALESFKNPKHIMKSKNGNKIELALQTVDNKGNNILSIIAINTVTLNGNKMLDAHIVTSAYGRKNIENYISKAKNEGRLIEYKKEESTQGTPQVQYEGSINANSSKDCIPQFSEKSQEKLSDRDYSYANISSSEYYENGIIYSYDFLVSQDKMDVVDLPKTGALANSKGKIDDSKVLSLGIKNALIEGTKRDNKIYVKNKYTNRELRIDNSTIKHGLDGTYNRHITNARIGSVIGTVVKNAIPINGLKNTSQSAVGTYAMVSYCRDDLNREFIAIITVEQHSGDIDSFEIYDVSHAVSGRQKRSSQVDTKSQGVNPIKAATISIYDLLKIVNSTHQSILSEDVLEHLGEQRNLKGSYSDKVLFSDRDPKTAENIKKINKQLTKENLKLTEDVKRLKELVKLQSKETHGKMLKKSTVELVAKRLMTYSNAKGDVSELVSHLTDVYNYIIGSFYPSKSSIAVLASSFVKKEIPLSNCRLSSSGNVSSIIEPYTSMIFSPL